MGVEPGLREEPGAGLPPEGPLARDPWFLGALVVALLGALHGILTVSGGIATEEPFHGTAAALLAAGHPWDLPRLQYTTFCGGCTVESLLILPWFWAFGPRVIVWKVLTLCVVAAQIWVWATVAQGASGRTAARVTAWALALAPTFFRVGGRVSFGSHYEVMVGVGAMFLLLARWWRLGGAGPSLALGLGAGLVHAFSYTGDLILPPVLILGLARWRAREGRTRDAAAALLGLLLGALPWLLTQWSLGDQGAFGDGGPLLYGDRGRGLFGGLAAVGTRWRSLGSSGAVSGLFFPSVERGGAPLGWAVLCALLVGLALTIREGWRRRRDEGRPPWEWLLAGAFLTWLTLFLLMAPILTLDTGRGLTGNPMRYLLPAIPLLATALGLAVAQVFNTARGRGLAVALGGLALGPGGTSLLIDLGSWQPEARALSLSLPTLEPWDDLRGGAPVTPPGPGPFWIDDADERDAPTRHRHALQLHARAWGRAFAQALAEGQRQGELEAIGPALEGADGSDRYALFLGFLSGVGVQACGLPWEGGGVSGPWSRGEPLGESRSFEGALAGVLRRLGPEARRDLLRAAFDTSAPILANLGEALGQGGRHPGLDWLRAVPPGEAAASVERAVLEATGLAAFRVVESGPDGASSLSRAILALAPGQRAPFAWGLGVAAGIRYGHAPEAVRAFAETMPDPERDDVIAGARVGAERTFVGLPGF